MSLRISMATLHVRRSAQSVALAAGCLAAALPGKWAEAVELLDFFPDQDDAAICSAILATRPDLVIFPLYLWNRQAVCRIATLLRRKSPSLRLAAGGPEATPRAEAVLAEAPFDAVIRGEGEQTLPEWLGVLDRRDAWEQIAGLSWRGSPGIRHNPPREPAADLDSFPSPWLAGRLRPTPEGGVLWEVARGCPFTCAFCYDAGGCRRVRHHGMQRLEQELEHFVKLGVSQVWVLDSTFNYPPERGLALLKLLRRIGRSIHFHLEAKADFLDRETASMLGQIHCSVQVGLQSADKNVLRQVRRSIDLRLFSHALHLLNSEGVTFGLDLIYGLPGDDFAGFCRSLGYALEHAPNHIDIFPLAVLPGTALSDQAEELQIDYHREPPYTINATPALSREDFARCQELAAAVDLFYNLGRAVGFLPSLLRSLDLSAVDFFSRFAEWARHDQGIFREVLLDTAAWRAEEVVMLQESFIQQLLIRRGRLDLWPAALDLIRYHFHYAETLLGRETLPQVPTRKSARGLWKTRWKLAPGVRLIPFNYEIVDLLEMGGADLEEFAGLFRPVGSVALFLRRGDEVLCESLQEDFLRLLRDSDGKKSPDEIFVGGIDRREGEELVEFAVSEGILIA